MKEEAGATSADCNKLAVDLDQIAGDGLSVDGVDCPTLKITIPVNCLEVVTGVTCNEDGTLTLMTKWIKGHFEVSDTEPSGCPGA